MENTCSMQRLHCQKGLLIDQVWIAPGASRKSHRAVWFIQTADLIRKHLLSSVKKRLSCDWHSWPGRSRASGLAISGRRFPVPPKPEPGAHLPCPGAPAGLAAGAAGGNLALTSSFRYLFR